MNRQVTRADLPSKQNRGNDSLKIPVFYKGELRFICDIHFGDDTLCYLEECEGEPTKLEELTKLTKEESSLFIKMCTKTKYSERKRISRSYFKSME